HVLALLGESHVQQLRTTVVSAAPQVICGPGSAPSWSRTPRHCSASRREAHRGDVSGGLDGNAFVVMDRRSDPTPRYARSNGRATTNDSAAASARGSPPGVR